MTKRIVYTRHKDGGVSVCTPTAWALQWLSCGGFWGIRPRGWYDAQVERQIARGVHADAARRFVKAMVLGGCNTQEAYAIIRDRDCAHLGYHIELMNYDELPNRWFRNAWKRSANGGPVDVDLRLARPLQWQHVRAAVAAENKTRAESFDANRPVAADWEQIRSAIRHARDEEELRRVWPAELHSSRGLG